jgi:hypothetical protein
VVKPLVALHEAGRVRGWVVLESMASPRDVQQADLLVFCRNVRADRGELLRSAVRHGVPVLYDLDDNFFELPPDSDVGRDYAQPEQLAMLTEYLSSASLVRVYSQPLLARAAALNPNVEFAVSAVDLRQVRQATARPGGPIKLVYATSRLDDSLGAIFLPALQRLLQESGSQIEAHFWGPRPPAELCGVRHHAIVHDYDRFLQQFSSAGFEIGVAPLADDIFHRSKTNTKFREYGACRIAGVYSDLSVYSDSVRHGETGLLVPNTTEAWYRAMRQLVDDVALRRKIQQQARAVVERHYSQERFEAMFLGQIERLLRNRQPRRTVEIEAAHDGPRQPRLGRILGLIPQGIGHLRRTGLARTWNTLRWFGSSSLSLARLQWRLRDR